MSHSTVRVTQAPGRTWVVHLDRPDARNTITPTMLAELDAVRAAAEDADVQVLALRGTPQVFCTGMDLAGAAAGTSADGSPFFDLLMRLRQTPLLVVSLVEGQVAGGGVGLVAASDLVLATAASTYALPEALWGLLPCCVAPFLAERVGRHAALRMALTTTAYSADDAARLGLVDQLVDDPDQALRRLSLRVGRIERAVQGRTKSYFARLPDRADQGRSVALAEFAEVMATPLVARNLNRYAREGVFPWER